MCVTFYNLGTFLHLKSIQEVNNNAVTLKHAPSAPLPAPRISCLPFFNSVSILYTFVPFHAEILIQLVYSGILDFCIYILKRLPRGI